MPTAMTVHVILSALSTADIQSGTWHLERQLLPLHMADLWLFNWISSCQKSLLTSLYISDGVLEVGQMSVSRANSITPSLWGSNSSGERTGRGAWGWFLRIFEKRNRDEEIKVARRVQPVAILKTFQGELAFDQAVNDVRECEPWRW